VKERRFNPKSPADLFHAVTYSDTLSKQEERESIFSFQGFISLDQNIDPTEWKADGRETEKKRKNRLLLEAGKALTERERERERDHSYSDPHPDRRFLKLAGRRRKKWNDLPAGYRAADANDYLSHLLSVSMKPPSAFFLSYPLMQVMLRDLKKGNRCPHITCPPHVCNVMSFCIAF